MTTKPGESGAADVSAADDDFDKAWDDYDAEDAAAAEEPADDTSAADETDPASDDLDLDDKPTTAEPPAVKADEPAKPSDVWANASPELIAERDRLLAAVEAEKQRARSDSGRAAAYQRRYEELRAAKPKAEEPPAEDDEDLQAAQREYPEVVAPLMKKIERQQARLDEIVSAEHGRETAAIAAREALEAAESAKLEAAMPGYIDLFTVEDGAGNRVESPEYLAWYRTRATPEARAAIDRNANGIVDAKAAAEALGAYKAFIDRFNAPAAGGTPAANPTSTRRQRQIDSSRAVTRSSQQSGITSAVPNDYDAAWDHLDRLDEAKASRAR
jgi:hypothetical protein